MPSFAVELDISAVQKQIQTQPASGFIEFSIEFSHLCEAFAEQIMFGGTVGSEKQWKLVQWVCIWLDVVPSSQAALHEHKGFYSHFDLGPDLVYHRKILQDCWLECRAAMGCAAPSCLRVRMFEDV